MSPDCSSTTFSCSLLGIIAYCLFPVLHKKQVIKTSGTITQTLASSLRVSAEPHQQPSSRQLLLACQNVSVSLVTFSGFLFYSVLFFFGVFFFPLQVLYRHLKRLFACRSRQRGSSFCIQRRSPSPARQIIKLAEPQTRQI